MANKSNLSTILGVAGATVLAAGGSAFLTDTGLQMVEKNNAVVQETEVAITERETELPITVETFTSTKDSFTVKPVSATENKKKDSEKTDTEKKDSSSTESTSGNAEGGSSSEVSAGNSYYDEDGNYVEGSSSDSDSSSGSSSSGGTATNGKGSEPVEYDEWGGWIAANGDYYDGQGGYYNESGYHKVGDSGSGSGSGSSDSGSSGGSSDDSSYNDYAWDDSYILYDTSVRYISEDELRDWSADELAIARNEIFARHGRIFVTPEWSSYFAQKTWYVPKYDDVDDMLSDCEWANLKVIMKLEDRFY